MKISIRPAPHSNRCALDGRKSCDLYQNHPEKCAEKCTENMCCEMKHCWLIGEALERELIRRGHTVYMADKKYRKSWPSSKATASTRSAMKELNAHSPDMHLAIHTNANGNPAVRGVQAMYPPAKYGQRTEKSKRLCSAIANAIEKIYDARVSTREYSAIETSSCPGAGCYLELGYGNTNTEDAKWVHEYPEQIASSIADGIELWWQQEGNALPAPAAPTLEERIAALETWRETLENQRKETL